MKASFIISLVTICLGVTAHSQNFNDLDVSPLDIASFPTSYRDSDKSIRVIYSRPQLKGRELSALTPEGKVWRTGANEATEITLYDDFIFGETKVKAGTYSLYTIPGQESWTVIINSATNVWGAYGYNNDLDVARLDVPVKKLESPVEALSMVFEKVKNGAHLHIAWGHTHIAVPFTKS
ncbi:MAG: DUF2911 domain-containing protein [Flavobacteriaceae bacterium]|nr:DUF2911 domain-containing protein [Flavobacteriaceae bacterium]MCY4266411.1 DUF2911 domain-containing protein [Flavobacteriaceae bacterium]MCY4298526.1 DUF2911 domain-containing protein [Flavobacteriaceae bacterium]